jgi:hypothetical protein
MKRMLFGAVAVAVAIAGIEAGSWLLLRLAAVPELEPRLRQLLSDPDAVRPLRALRHQEPEGFREEAIHPYLGFVTVPPSQVRDGPLTLEALGLPGGGPLVREARPDTLVLGVFGGSLAQYFAIGDGPQRLFTGLQSLPEFAGRRLVVLNAAHSSYKQPQAEMALSYLLALGAHLDLVILIDGFNEVAGAPLEYENTGLFPLYPSRWVLRVANLDADTKMRLLIGEIAYRKEERARWADRLLHSRALHSRTVALLWAFYDGHTDATLAARRQDLARRRSGQAEEFVATGPRYRDEGRLYDDLVTAWAAGSLGMHAVAREHGFRFFHFLQPNQHVRGSKPLAPEEVEILRGGEVYAPHVERGYPLLRAKGDELRRRGVAFADLTEVFAELPEPIYVDNCCHVGPHGNELLADAMAAAIRVEVGRPLDARPRARLGEP